MFWLYICHYRELQIFFSQMFYNGKCPLSVLLWITVLNIVLGFIVHLLIWLSNIISL